MFYRIASSKSEMNSKDVQNVVLDYFTVIESTDGTLTLAHGSGGKEDDRPCQ